MEIKTFYDPLYYQKNKSRIRISQRKHYLKFKKRYQIYAKNWSKKNRKRLIELSRKWRKNNHEKVKESLRRYAEKNKNNPSWKDLVFLWHRDKASKMFCPSVDRMDSKGNYVLSNCRFIEKSENVARAHRGIEHKTSRFKH